MVQKMKNSEVEEMVILIIVNDLISIDVVRLPEVVFVSVEETVGVVLELNALKSQRGVRQQPELGGDQPGLGEGGEMISTETVEVLHIGRRHQEV